LNPIFIALPAKTARKRPEINHLDENQPNLTIFRFKTENVSGSNNLEFKNVNKKP